MAANRASAKKMDCRPSLEHRYRPNEAYGRQLLGLTPTAEPSTASPPPAGLMRARRSLEGRHSISPPAGELLRNAEEILRENEQLPEAAGAEAEQRMSLDCDEPGQTSALPSNEAAATTEPPTAESSELSAAAAAPTSEERQQSAADQASTLPKPPAEQLDADISQIIFPDEPDLTDCQQTIYASDSTIIYAPKFLSEVADQVYERLITDLLPQAFQHRPSEQRRVYWIGPSYTYSGVELKENLDWHQVIEDIRDFIYHDTQFDVPKFNSVLVNFYTEPGDRIPWHSDDEDELGDRPTIATVSFGAERLFMLRRRDGNVTHRFPTLPGSLILMAGNCQKRLQHQVPAAHSQNGVRISLTFRVTKPELRRKRLCRMTRPTASR
ncbi:hypothetical protein BOX15_Mlig027759g7 [Macrostomum lignano]|uniref:Fe2OG dioxygenase domain-containing protein n=1 Tax=Macrostomum lignano TaxID=282301 RepID=A0A267DYY1_9PLAT|nr:hypothetical protein BOX15_Mlig027759g7 [Macrostomum lignano]